MKSLVMLLILSLQTAAWAEWVKVDETDKTVIYIDPERIQKNAEFRTGWFVESLLTELLVALVVRTQGPCYRSRPATNLLVITAMVVCVALILPYSPVAGLFDFVPLPPHLLLALVGVSLAYAATVEWGKQVFYRRR